MAMLLAAAGADTDATAAPRPSLNDLPEHAASAVLDCYRRLGGRHEHPRLRPGGWDIALPDTMVELDEHLHFNRYRALTLDAPIYNELQGFPVATYAQFCREHEADCRAAGSYGGKWSNPSCEKHFGPAGPLGHLDGAGAPRWRQRALYDFMKDLSPLIEITPVARIAIWDELPGLDGITVEKALTAEPLDLEAGHALLRLVESRAAGGEDTTPRTGPQ